MLSRIPGWKFREWKYYEELEPFPAERADWNMAHIAQLLVRNGKQLKEFMLPFGDLPTSAEMQQPVAYQEMLIDAWITGSNAVIAARGKRGN
jgi:hypothetical protein